MDASSENSRERILAARIGENETYSWSSKQTEVAFNKGSNETLSRQSRKTKRRREKKKSPAHYSQRRPRQSKFRALLQHSRGRSRCSFSPGVRSVYCRTLFRSSAPRNATESVALKRECRQQQKKGAEKKSLFRGRAMGGECRMEPESKQGSVWGKSTCIRKQPAAAKRTTTKDKRPRPGAGAIDVTRRLTRFLLIGF